ncbi:hypothetical protein ACH4E7_35080 [Kitasatospora sp. NPDC018058]|uniref:hypothetical protein n=1 Tax=Kitasatospora sp. NPDC018058 TaxID=3364025 RepID=UPI0037C11B95
MRFTVTAYDDHGSPATRRTVELPALRALLAEAAATGRRLHIRPAPRAARPHGGHPHPLTTENAPRTLDILNV